MTGSCLDLWNGRRKKPLVTGQSRLNPKEMGFNDLMIHNERMAKLKAAREITNRESLMPHVRRNMPKGADPKPERPEKPRETTFQPLKLEDPSSPPAEARSAEDEAEAVREGSNVSASEASDVDVPKDGLAQWNARRSNAVLAEAKKAEAETLDRKAKTRRKQRTKKRKLTPGKERHVKGKA